MGYISETIGNLEHYQRCKNRDAIMRSPDTADNMDVRKAILARVKAGEITLAQGQAELAAIQRNARKTGQQTAYGKSPNDAGERPGAANQKDSNAK